MTPVRAARPLAEGQLVRLRASPAVIAPRPRQRAILVLGVSRSGTSLTTRLCGLAGAALPSDLLGADFGNLLGHWEPRPLVTLNEEVLAALDRRWDDPRPVPEQWFHTRQAHAFLLRLRETVARCCAAAPLAVLKDPRIVPLLPLYLDALDMLDIEPLIVLQVREPAEVVQSLAQRDGLDRGLAELLWVRGVIAAERRTRGCPRVWIDARAAIDDWRGALRRIAGAFHLAWPDPEEIAPEVERFIKPRLLRRVAAAAPQAASPGLIAGLAWVAIGQAQRGEAAAAEEAFDALQAVLDDMERLQGRYIEALVADRRRLGAVLASRSWRLTQPLRLLGGAIRWAAALR